jgi:hypothetical protein
MGHGGARYGAGRPAVHVTVEGLRRLDIRAMARDGGLSEGGMWIWRDLACASFSTADDVLTLRHDLQGRAATQQIQITHTACHYGGTRPWFACPGCSRRVAVLLLAPGGFFCRRCAGAAYLSQRQGTMDRAASAAKKAGDRLRKDGGRPKRMRHLTYMALLAHKIAAERRYSEAVEGFAARVLPQLASIRA